MAAVTDDPGELLFERYIAQHGGEILAKEPDLGTRKRPDYLIRLAGHEIVVEVKSFNATVPVPQPGRTEASPSPFTSVRKKIMDGAAQLKGISPYPLMVVLANPRNLPLPLSANQMIAAMYGDPEATVTEDGLWWRTGGNGRLHVEEPDGTVRGHHPYVSAVGVLRGATTADAAAAVILNQGDGRHTNVLDAFTTAVTQAEPGGVEGDAVSIDVFETVSTPAVPLPADVFCGPADTRWGKISEGRYGRRVLSSALIETEA